ncbi:MotA/TolQ/ExbB proton channel family protein [Luteolibacter pohnpeiensis]|uniref:MotA/TolQ/ExbB proton channel family protein n=1 Tax=Luteolibacter pohnpeiensis TaxID=454153 RepID=A0A934VTU4_9BACT|nr:MotA/TolQ/ExbB proton channel family protein [Luteolibacter pohnpeiensis]MBK1881842.1 MotA/TolQ/ExbB proton channel family protein [Luteolibacter pohnpeiensis]
MKMPLKTALTTALFLLPVVAFGAEPEKKTLFSTYQEGGWVMHLLLVCSIAMVWLIIDVTLRTGKKKMTPPVDVATAQELFRAGDYVGAYQAMRAGFSPFCEVVRSSLGSVGHGKDATEETLYATVDKINSTLQTRINYLSVIGVCAPMIGLLGTVGGMRGAFGSLGASGLSDVGGLAQHIGEVLVATATGLLVAIPSFAAFYFLRNRLQGAIHQLQEQSERLFRNAPYDYLQNADVGQEETYAAMPNWIEAPEG